MVENHEELSNLTRKPEENPEGVLLYKELGENLPNQRQAKERHYWLKSSGSLWCKLELSSCKGTSTPALLYSSLPIKPCL